MPGPDAPPQQPDSLVSVAVVSLTRGLSLVLTLALGVLTAAQFGASSAKDCYLVAQTLPALLGTLVVGGLYSLLITALSEVASSDGTPGQRALLGKVLRQTSYILVPLAIITLLVPTPFVRLVAPGFGPAEIQLSGRLLGLTMLTMVASVYFTLIRALFSTRHLFAAPGMVNLLPGGAAIVTLILGAGALGIHALAIGPLLGTILSVVVLGFMALRLLRGPRDEDPRSVAPRRAAMPGRNLWRDFLSMSIGANFGQMNLLVDNAFTSFLPAGTITRLAFAAVIVANAEALTIFSLAEVSLPRFAAAARQGAGRLSEMVRTDLRYMLLLTAPISVGCLTFGAPLTRLLFERGQFGPDSTDAVARILACLAPEVLFMGYLAIFWRLLVALGNLRALLWISIAGMSLNAALDYVLMRRFGIEGIALSTSLVTTLMSIILGATSRRNGVRIFGAGDGRFTCKVMVSALLMGAAVLGWSALFERAFDVSREWVRLVEAGGGLVLGAGVHAALLQLMGIRDIAEIGGRLVRLAAFWRRG